MQQQGLHFDRLLHHLCSANRLLYIFLKKLILSCQTDETILMKLLDLHCEKVKYFTRGFTLECEDKSVEGGGWICNTFKFETGDHGLRPVTE